MTLKKLYSPGLLKCLTNILRSFKSHRNFRVVDLSLAKVDVCTTSTTEVINEFKDCPFFVNALITSGKYNLCLFFTATNLRRLEGIVNHHLRGNPKVKELDLNIVISTAKDFIHPLNIDYSKKPNCDQECADL